MRARSSRPSRAAARTMTAAPPIHQRRPGEARVRRRSGRASRRPAEEASGRAAEDPPMAQAAEGDCGASGFRGVWARGLVGHNPRLATDPSPAPRAPPLSSTPAQRGLHIRRAECTSSHTTATTVPPRPSGCDCSTVCPHRVALPLARTIPPSVVREPQAPHGPRRLQASRRGPSPLLDALASSVRGALQGRTRDSVVGSGHGLRARLRDHPPR